MSLVHGPPSPPPASASPPLEPAAPPRRSPPLASWAIRPHVAFLLIGTVFGLALIALTPPFQVPDEPAHFLRAYQISECRFLAHQDARGEQLGGYLPRSLWRTVKLVSSDIAFHSENRQDLRTLADALKLPLDPGRRLFCSFPSAARYPPPLYAPQAIGIAAGRLLPNPSPLLLFYLARLANLLAWLAMGYAVLRCLPAARWLMLLVMLMPMSLFVSASVSADALTNAFCFLFVAVILRWTVDERARITPGKMAGLVLLGVVIALCKAVYVPLLGLFLMVPVTRFASRRTYWTAFVMLLVVSIGAGIAWWLPAMQINVALREGDLSATRQLGFILHHPLQFAQMNVQSLEPAYLGSTIGHLGWLDTPMGGPFQLLYLALLLLAALADGQPDVPLGLRRKAILAAAAVASWVGVNTVLYLTWTAVAQPRIEGLQGRYLIPLVPLVLLLLYNRRLECSRSRLVGPLLACASVAACVFTMVVIMRRYYVG